MNENLYKKILVPVDGSTFSKKAAKDANFIAKLSNSEVILLGVIENSFSLELPTDETVMQIKMLLQYEANKNLDEIKKEFDKDIKTTTKIDEGSPAEVILNTIEDENIDLVVMGSSGKRGLDKFLLGSVTDKVVNSAKCKILVIH